MGDIAISSTVEGASVLVAMSPIRDEKGLVRVIDAGLHRTILEVSSDLFRISLPTSSSSLIGSCAVGEGLRVLSLWIFGVDDAAREG